MDQPLDLDFLDTSLYRRVLGDFSVLKLFPGFYLEVPY